MPPLCRACCLTHGTTGFWACRREDLTKCEYVPTALHPSQCNDPYATKGPIDNMVFFLTGQLFLNVCPMHANDSRFVLLLFSFSKTQHHPPTQQAFTSRDTRLFYCDSIILKTRHLWLEILFTMCIIANLCVIY